MLEWIYSFTHFKISTILLCVMFYALGKRFLCSPIMGLGGPQTQLGFCVEEKKTWFLGFSVCIAVTTITELHWLLAQLDNLWSQVFTAVQVHITVLWVTSQCSQRNILSPPSHQEWTQHQSIKYHRMKYLICYFLQSNGLYILWTSNGNLTWEWNGHKL